MLRLLSSIEDQMRALRLPLVGITLTALPHADTPVVLNLHWHGFLPADPELQAGSWLPVPSTTLQLNERWDDLLELDRSTLDAAWQLGAWDVARERRPACLRPGATAAEALDCLRAFGSYPGGGGEALAVVDAPDADELIATAARNGYLTWQFRPVCGGLWCAARDDRTLAPDGSRRPPCPFAPVAESLDTARWVVRFGRVEPA